MGEGMTINNRRAAMNKILGALLLCVAMSALVFAQTPAVKAVDAAPIAVSGQHSPADFYGLAALQHPPTPDAAKARDLIVQMIEAMGGEAYLGYRTVTQEGRIYSFYNGSPTSAGTLFWRFNKLPDMDRTELTKQRDVVYIYNKDAGYELTYKGTAAAEKKELAEYLRRRDRSLETVLRSWLADPRTMIINLGSGLADKRLTLQVSILAADNKELVLSIDPRSHLLMQKSYHFRAEDGYKDEEIELYGGYHKIQGVQTPFTVTRMHNGEITGQRFITKVQYDLPMDDKIFEAKVTYDPYHYREK